MMKKNMVLIILSILLLLICLCILVVKTDLFRHKTNLTTTTKIIKKNIPSDYIVVFHGEENDNIYETYIYKIDNNRENYGFKYINIVGSTSLYGNSNWNYRILDEGDFDWTDGAFGIAKNNHAYSYVTKPNDEKKYTIEEFQSMFLMN